MLTGVFLNDLTQQAAALAQWERFAPRPDFLLAFVDAQPTWDHIANIGWATAYMAPTKLPVCWSVPMLPTNGDRLDVPASGRCNSYFRRAAEILANYPHKLDDAQMIRIGWEMTSNYPWWVQICPQNTPVAYADTWRHIVDQFRSVSDEFRFVWCGNSGNQVWGDGSPVYVYPGDDYVDAMGCDAYQGQHAKTVADQQWLGGWGIDFFYDLSQCQNDRRAGQQKPFALPEWGVVNGGAAGTDEEGAQYIRDQWEWLRAKNVALHCYWNGDAGSSYDGQLDNGSKPLSARAWQETFGAGCR